MTTSPKTQSELFIALASASLTAAARWKKEADKGLAGAREMEQRLLSDADRYARKAEKLA